MNFETEQALLKRIQKLEDRIAQLEKVDRVDWNDPLTLGNKLTITDGGLEVTDDSYVPIITTRVLAATTGAYSILWLILKSTGNMADTFGPVLGFQIQDDAAGPTMIGYIGVIRAGADNTGDMIFYTMAAGTAAEKLRITSDGKIRIVPTSGKLEFYTDVNLYRYAADYLKTDDNFIANALYALNAYLNSDTAEIKFGSTYDVRLYRSGADALKTDDSFEAVAVKAQGHYSAIVYTQTDETLQALTPAVTLGNMIINVRGTAITDYWGAVDFRCTTTPHAIKCFGGAGLEVGTATGVPTVSSYTDLKVTIVASDNGNMYVVNRRGGSLTYGITFLGA